MHAERDPVVCGSVRPKRRSIADDVLCERRDSLNAYATSVASSPHSRKAKALSAARSRIAAPLKNVSALPSIEDVDPTDLDMDDGPLRRTRRRNTTAWCSEW